MKNMTCLLTAMALGTVLTACGGGGGSQDVAATDSSPSARIASVTAGPDTPLYTVTLLASAASSYAIDLNDSGQVVGNYLDANNSLNVFHWQGQMVESVVNNGQVSRINNHGQIVGWRDHRGQSEAFLYETDGKMVRLNALGGASQALAINDLGETAGRVTLGSEKSFAERNGAMQFIAKEIDGYAVAMNDTGDILIREVVGDSCRTLLWQNDTLINLGDLGGALTVGSDLNNSGQVVGWAQTATGDYHPFLWENGVMTDLSHYTGSFGAAVAINEAGVILLKTFDTNGTRNFLLDNGSLTDLGNFGSDYAVVNDLNNRGQIVGWMADTAGVMQAFLATPKK